MQENCSPRNESRFLHIRSLPNFFCVLTQKAEENKLALICKSEDDLDKFLGSTIQVLQQTYQIIALVLHDPVAMHYLVAHHAKEQRGDSVFLYDSIQGVQSRDIWATLLSRPELQIEAIHIRSGHINALYPAVALLNSLPEIIKHHAEPEEIMLHQPNSSPVREPDQHPTRTASAGEGNPALASLREAANIHYEKTHTIGEGESKSHISDQADKRSDAEQGSEANSDLSKPVPGVQIVPKPLSQNVPKVAPKPLALETGETSPGLPNCVQSTLGGEINPDLASPTGLDSRDSGPRIKQAELIPTTHEDKETSY